MPTIKKPRIYTTSYGRYQFVREGSSNRPMYRIQTSAEAKIEATNHFRDTVGETFQEHFKVLTLDTKHVPIAWYYVTTGILDASLVHPREVFKWAFIDSAHCIIVAHNHPSGDPTPSREDHSVTDRLTEAGRILGIQVLDHIVVGDGTWQSVSCRDIQ